VQNAGDGIAIIVQIESVQAVANIEEITVVGGVAAVFIGPSDLAASMGLLSQQDPLDVVAAVEHCIATVNP
jgi:4-hydroxy-2-oxoheptanedioate aldolase